MADYNSSLPVRTETNGDVAVKVVDSGTPSQTMAVDSDGNAHVKVHGTNPGAGDEVLRLSELGAPNPDGVYSGTDNTKPAHVGLIAATRAGSPADSDQTKRLTAITNSTVHALDVAIRDGAGAAFSVTNPLPVEIAESSGAEVWDYQTSAAVAAGASVDIEYTVTALKTLLLSEVSVTGSGKIKAIVKLETAAASGTFNNKEVGFNSTANPNIKLECYKILKQVAGAKVRVTITNNDNQAQDVYCTIKGIEV